MINISNLSRELFDQNKIAVVTCHFVTFFWALTPLVILNIMIFYFVSPLFPSIFAMAKESRLSHCDLQLLESQQEKSILVSTHWRQVTTMILI